MQAKKCAVKAAEEEVVPRRDERCVIWMISRGEAEVDQLHEAPFCVLVKELPGNRPGVDHSPFEGFLQRDDALITLEQRSKRRLSRF